MEFTSKMNSFGKWKELDDKSEQSEFAISFHEQEDGLVKVTSSNGEFVYKLKQLQDLYTPGGLSIEVIHWKDSRNIQLLHNIEGAIRRTYEADPELTDSSVMLALDAMSMKPEQRVSNSPIVKEINNSLRLLLSTENYSRDEVKKAIRKVLASVKRHRDAGGIRGYLEFILEQVP